MLNFYKVRKKENLVELVLVKEVWNEKEWSVKEKVVGTFSNDDLNFHGQATVRKMYEPT